MLIACTPAYATTDRAPQIVILNSYDQNAAPHFRSGEIFKAELQNRHSTLIGFQELALQQTTKDSGVDYDLLAQLMRNRFAKTPPDLIVAFGPPASRFWLQVRDSVFPDAGFIAAAAESTLAQLQFRANDRIVATRFSFTSAIEDILQLFPETSNVLMVFGPSSLERAWAAESRRQLEPWSGRIRFEYSSDLSIGELQSRLATLPADSAVYFGIFNTDANTISLPRHSGLTLVRESSNAPVFGAFENQLGHGIIGGRLIQADRIGRELAAAAEDMLNGELTSDNWNIIELSQPSYDWKELQAWGIKAAMLLPGSELRFRPPGLWEEYSFWIILAVLFVSAQSFMVVSLLYQNRRRKRAEAARIDLSRKLVNANENERRLLARELHDDLSQRLARVAIDASYANTHRETDAGKEAARNLYPDLVSISKDVHDMSYRLHPSLVDDLGIVAALETELERIRRQTEVKVIGEFSETKVHASHDAALCIYRIAQEALQNAVRHSRASAIRLAFGYDGTAMRVTVRDDGIGFDVANGCARASLGLLNMEDRARLAGGTFSIHSRMGEGTVVTATIPATGISA